MTEQTFEGRLFGPGLPGTGAEAVGSWNGQGCLRVSVEGTPRTELLAENPAIAAAGFNAASLRITWEDDGGAYAFVIEKDAARATCGVSAPPGIASRILSASGSRECLERRFRFGGVLLALFLALPLILIGVFLLNSDRVADWAVKRIPHEQEARLGDLVLAQTRLQMKILDSGPAVDAVSAIGSKLTTGSLHRYRWFVADRPDVNAFAAPGGVVVVFSGLIRSAGSAEELAGVLAHEVAHAELRHSLRGMVKSLGLRALVSLLTGDVSGGVFADAATRLTELRFSREAEREADDEGLRRLVKARIDPNGMLRFYMKLASEGRPSPPPLLSTHPATGERLERLRREVAGLKQKWVPLPIDLTSLK
ncbi:MAG TPA: hypothetical protein DCZ63_03265 [Geobacter sp.]|nr:hypothetical protein [Geobacter sp.]